MDNDNLMAVPMVIDHQSMKEAACRALHELLGNGNADDPMHHPAESSWDEPSMKRWQQWGEAVDLVVASFGIDSTR